MNKIRLAPVSICSQSRLASLRDKPGTDVVRVFIILHLLFLIDMNVDCATASSITVL